MTEESRPQINYLRRPPRHGTYSEYVSGACRCDKCRAAASKYQRDRRRAKIHAMMQDPDDPRHGEKAGSEQGCRCERCKKYRRWASILRKYGLTEEQWNAMWSAQGECCAACGSDDPGSPKGWHVDHSHDTGEVRGILCHTCSVALGMVRESVDRLEALIRYLG